MLNRSLILVAVTAVACSPPAPAPASAPSAATSSAPAPRVFVEAMFVEAQTSRVADLSALSFAEIGALPGISLVASPNVIASDRVTAQITVDGIRLTVTPEVLASDDVRLDIRVTGEPDTTASRVLHDSQTSVLETNLPARHGGTTLLVVRPDLIRDDGDLRRVFERKMRERS